MACVAQLQKPFGVWSGVFQEQFNKQQSTLFVKKLLAVSISNITYLRAIFPEAAFGDRSLEDLHLKILRDDSKCPGACQVIKWVRGCFDALDKQYLRQMILGTLIESYTFRITYDDQPTINLYRNEDHIATSKSTSETKKATVSLLRTLMLLMQTLTPLPDDVLMTMKLLYYDKVTPPDYEPEGFKPTNVDYFLYENETTNISVGKVETPFHQMRLTVKTDARQFNDKTDHGLDDAPIASSPKNNKKKANSGFPSFIPDKQPSKEILGKIPESHSDSLFEDDFMSSRPGPSKSGNGSSDFEFLQKPQEIESVKKKTPKKMQSKKLSLSKKSKNQAASKLEEDMADETEELLSEKTKKLSVAPKNNKKTKVDLKVQENSPGDRERGVKRVTAAINEEYEFELEMMSENPSQEFPRRSKRKKASSTNKSLLV